MTSEQSPSSQELLSPSDQGTEAFAAPAPPAGELQPAVLDPDNPPWLQPAGLGLLKAVLTWLGSVGFLLFVPLILVIPYFIYLAATSGAAQPQDLLANKTFLLLSIVGVIPAHLLTFIGAYLVITSARKYPLFKTLGMEWPRSLSAWGGIGLCTLIAAVLLGLGTLITWVFGGQKTDLDLILESSFQARLVTAFLAVFTAPIVEEVIYRGMLYPAFARLVHPVVAIILVSLLFAGVHFYQYRNNLAVVAVITILSATLTTVRAVTHRLLPSFIIHLVFNGIQSVMILVQGVAPKEPVTPPPVPGIELVSLIFRHFF